MNKTVAATVVLLLDDKGRVCLAPKKQNIHKQGQELEHSRKKWNGYGGKQEPGETILATAIRELTQESGVLAKEEDLELVGIVGFSWPGNETDEPDMLVYFFLLSTYNGLPSEGDEMGAPCFFHPHEVPYDDMMPADAKFLPKLLTGEKLVWHVHLGKMNPDGGIYFEDKKIEPTLP